MIQFLKPVAFWATFINLAVLATGSALIISHSDLPPLVPLWLSLPWGEARLASPENLWLIVGRKISLSLKF
jgi:hypothetical protein